MTGDLNLPPRHRLPANVHDRIRTTVLAGIRRPAPSWQNRARPPLAVAAGVAVLAVGVGIVVQSATEGPGGGPGPTRPPSSTLQPPPLDPAAAAVDLDRCWAQLQQSGKAGSVSARETWVPVFAVTEFGRTMTAARAAGKPLFCETTRTTVTVSDPNATPGYARGTSTAAMLVSADGGIGGVVGPDWRSMVFLTVAPSGASEQTEAFIKDGLFVAFTQMATGTKARFTVRQTEPGHPERPIYEGDVSTPAGPGETVAGQSHPELNLPAPAAALVATTDRPIPDPDLSDKGRFLAECIANSDSAVVDPQLWEAVTITGTAPYRAVLARAGQEAVGCSMQGNRTDRNDPNVITPHYTFTPPFAGLKADRPVQFVVWQMIGTENAQAVLGLLRPDVASMELDGPDLDATPVPIESGAFAFTAPAPRDGGPLPELTVVLRNAAGAEIYRGPVSP